MKVVGEVPLQQVCSPERGAPKGMSLRVFPNLGRTHSAYVNNSLFIFSLLSDFVEKKYFHGNVRTYKIGGASLA
jgi:hypothetical protein